MSVSNLFYPNNDNLFCNNLDVAGVFSSSNFFSENFVLPIIYSGDGHQVAGSHTFQFFYNGTLLSCYFPFFSDTIPIGGPTPGYYYVIIPTDYIPIPGDPSAQQCITVVGAGNNTGTIFVQPAGASSEIRIYNGVGQVNFPGTATIPQGLPFGTVINYV